MPTVTNTLKAPDGTLVSSASVQIELAGTDGVPIKGYVTAGDYSFIGYHQPTVTAGVWSVTLVANALINPSGTRWKVSETHNSRTHIYYLSVPDGAGPYFVEDILSEAPGAIDEGASASITAHLVDTGDAHDASAVSFSPVGTVDASDVQAAIAETARAVVPAAPAADDTAGLAAALSRAITEGEPLRLRAGTYRTTQVLSPTAGVVISGAGIGRTVLKWADGAGHMPGTGTAEGSGLITAKETNGITSGLEVRDLTLDCNKAGNSGMDTTGIVMAGLTDCLVERVEIKNAYGLTPNGEWGTGVRVRRMVSNPVGSSLRITVRNCVIHDLTGTGASYGVVLSNGPVQCTVSDNTIYSSVHGIDWSTGERSKCNNNTIEGTTNALGATNASFMTFVGNVIQDARNGLVTLTGSSFTVAGNYFEGDGNAAAIGLDLGAANSARTISGNHFLRFGTGIKLAGATKTTRHAIVGNTFQDAVVGVDVTGLGERHVIAHNTFKGATTAFVRLGASTSSCVIEGNVLESDSTTLVLAGTGHRIRGNLGHNPKGALSTPAVPASTVAYTNDLGYDASVFVAGGTVSAIAVGGTATGLTSGTVRVPVGQTITLTYSVAPTWTWFGD